MQIYTLNVLDYYLSQLCLLLLNKGGVASYFDRFISFLILKYDESILNYDESTSQACVSLLNSTLHLEWYLQRI